MLIRDDLLEQVEEKINSRTNVSYETLISDQARIHSNIVQGHVMEVCGYTERLISDQVLIAVQRMLHSNTDPWGDLSKSIALSYWANELQLADFKRENADYNYGDSDIYNRLFFHSMMLQAKGYQYADWIAPYLLNTFRHGGWFDADKEYGAFYQLLLEAQLSGEWISETSLTNKLAPEVVALFRSMTNPDQFRVELISYCDWRLARANKYPNFNASKKKGEYTFAVTWWGLFPFELFAVQAIYTRCTSREISLEVDHPLMHTMLMHPPKFLPIAETDEASQLAGFIRGQFGETWKPLASVPLI